MSNVQAATRSPQCSATLRLSCCVLAVPQSSASLQEGKLASQKDVHSGGNSTSLTRRGWTQLWMN